MRAYFTLVLPLLAAGWLCTQSALAAPASLTGSLDALSVCAADGAGDRVAYSLALPGNRSTPLQIDPEVLEFAGGEAGLAGRLITVEGEPDGGGMRVRSITPHGAAVSARPMAQIGARPYVVIRVRFSDTASSNPAPFVKRVPALFTGVASALPHYFRTLSYNQMTLDGSLILDPITLPKSLAAYRFGGDIDTNKLLADCVAAVDARVHFPDFYGILIVPNVNPFLRQGFITEAGRGGFATRTYDGVHRRWGLAFAGVLDHEIFAHEVLHSLGETGVLPHSSGPYSSPYDSRWDVMSKLGLGVKHAQFGKVGAETISHHRRFLGWIPPDAEFVPASGGPTTIQLRALSSGPARGSFLLARIPLGGTDSLFYTVEFRRRAGLYDKKIPATGVVVHRVDTRRADRQAQVVDATRNTNPNDAGSYLKAGEKFVDRPNGISVFIKGITAGAATVVITR